MLCLLNVYFVVIDPYFVLKRLLSLPLKNGVDILNFDTKSLNICGPYIFVHLTHIFNLSLAQGKVPADWKRSCVTPIYKGQGEHSDPSNYRPISIASTISKIFEFAVKEQVIKYLDNSLILSDKQSAYVKGLSTQTALHSIINNLASGMNKRHYNIVCSLDMAKGFDTISHKILLHKMSYYGFSDDTLKWFNSYLSDWSQIVKFNQQVSSELPLSIGVPQGSILGPILFLLYVNDLPSNFVYCNCEMYADDSTLNCNDPFFDVAAQKLQFDLNLAEKWLFDNQLAVNAKKSSVLVVSNRSFLKKIW